MKPKWRCPSCGNDLMVAGDPVMLKYYEDILKSGGMVFGPKGKCQACGAEFPISDSYTGKRKGFGRFR